MTEHKKKSEAKEQLNLNQQARQKDIKPFTLTDKMIKYLIISLLGLVCFILINLIIGFICGGVVYGSRMPIEKFVIVYAAIYLFSAACAGILVACLAGKYPLYSLIITSVLIIFISFLFDGSSGTDFLSIISKTAVTFIGVFAAGILTYKKMHPPRRQIIPRN